MYVGVWVRGWVGGRVGGCVRGCVRERVCGVGGAVRSMGWVGQVEWVE